MSLYRNILKLALKSTWQNKYLWIFGLFASILGTGGSYEILINGNINNSIFEIKKFLINTQILNGKFFINLSKLAITDPFSFFVTMFILITIFTIFFLLLYVAIVSQAALVNNAALIYSNKKHDFQNGIEAGKKNFLPVLSINIILKIIISLILIIISLPITFNKGEINYAQSIYYVTSFIILIPVVVIISFISKYAIAYIIIKKNNILKSIQNAWSLFKNNWLISLEMAFILLFINIIFNFILLLVILILAIPFLLLFFAFYFLKSLIAIWAIIFVGFLSLFLVISLAAAVLSTFQISSWTYLFIKLINGGGVSKLIRTFSK